MKKIFFVILILLFSSSSLFSQMDIQCITIQNDNIIVGNVDGLFISTNCGKIWETIIIDKDLTEPNITAISSTDKVLIIGLYDKSSSKNYLYRSIDSGNTWSRITSWSPLNSQVSCSYINSIVIDPDKILVMLNHSMYGSWCYINKNSDSNNWSRFFQDNNVHKTPENVYSYSGDIFILHPNFTMECDFYRTKNLGSTWKPIIVMDPITTYSLKGEPISLAINEYWYVATNKNIYLSSNTGTNWDVLNVPDFFQKPINVISTDSDKYKLLVGTNGYGLWLHYYNRWLDLSRKLESIKNSSIIFDKKVKHIFIDKNVVWCIDGNNNIFKANIRDYCSIDQEKNNLNIHPNPVTDYINIDQNIQKYKIYNLSGEIILESNNVNVNRIDANNLSSGSYYIWSETYDHKINFSKFIKK